MLLLSKNMISKFKTIWKQKNKSDPLLPLKLYDPITLLEWYPLEFKSNWNEFYGFFIINGHGMFGDFDLQEIMNYKPMFNSGAKRVKGIEYDTPQHFSALFGTILMYSHSMNNQRG